MVQTPVSSSTRYPDSDGKPMADNTEQYRWIAKLVTNLKHLLKDQTALVAGDLLWYPKPVEQGTPPVQAPDVLVALGRPDGRRGSYRQWQEENIAPQVVFEIISPSNTVSEMLTKQAFYAEHGAQEMYFYDPDSHNFWGLSRNGDEQWTLVTTSLLPWTSPLLKIRFELSEAGLAIFHPNGNPFKAPEAFALGEEQAQAERDQAQTERDQAQVERDEVQEKLDRAVAKLKAAGLDVSDV